MFFMDKAYYFSRCHGIGVSYWISAFSSSLHFFPRPPGLWRTLCRWICLSILFVQSIKGQTTQGQAKQGRSFPLRAGPHRVRQNKARLNRADHCHLGQDLAGLGLVRFPNSLGCELGERRSYSLWIELPGVFLPIFFIGRGKLGTELESSTQNLGSLISQTFKNLIGSAAERHFSLPPVCHFFGRPDIRAVFVLNKFRICEKLHFRFLPWFPDRFALN